MDRYKNVHLQLELEKSSKIICVAYKQTGEEHKFLVLTNIGRVCLQPTDKSMLVDIYYSSRALPELDISNYNHEGEYFIKSLVYKG